MKEFFSKKNNIIIVAVIAVAVLVLTVGIAVARGNDAEPTEDTTPSVQGDPVDVQTEEDSETESRSEPAPTEPVTESETETEKVPEPTKAPEKKPKPSKAPETTEDMPFVIAPLVIVPHNFPGQGGVYTQYAQVSAPYRDPNGGYLIDVTATIENKEGDNPAYNETEEGTVYVSFKDSDYNEIKGVYLEAGTLQPGESREVKKSIHLDTYDVSKVVFS